MLMIYHTISHYLVTSRHITRLVYEYLKVITIFSYLYKRRAFTFEFRSSDFCLASLVVPFDDTSLELASFAPVFCCASLAFCSATLFCCSDVSPFLLCTSSAARALSLASLSDLFCCSSNLFLFSCCCVVVLCAFSWEAFCACSAFNCLSFLSLFASFTARSFPCFSASTFFSCFSAAALLPFSDFVFLSRFFDSCSLVSFSLFESFLASLSAFSLSSCFFSASFDSFSAFCAFSCCSD